MKTKVPGWLTLPLVLGAFAALVWLERKRPLRSEVEPKLTRGARNLAVASVSAVALQLTESPVAFKLTALVEQHYLGLLKRLPLPAWLEVALAVILLDYTLYVWHVLTHKVPFLWRFHVAHHVDLDLDASTALRFHFGELVLSVWQTLLLLSILFHHSNVRLPVGVERWLNHLVVTPRMHGIHHSTVREETNSNWSSGLTVWDRLHGTLRLNVPQDEITIGVPAYREPEEVELIKVLGMPFAEQRPAWQLPNDGTPVRAASLVAADHLLP